MTLSRRGFLSGLGAALAAPAVVRSGILMPLRGIVMAPAIDDDVFGGYLLPQEFTIDMVKAMKEMMKVSGIPPYMVEQNSAVEACYIFKYQGGRLRPILESLARPIQERADPPLRRRLPGEACRPDGSGQCRLALPPAHQEQPQVGEG